MTLSEHDLIEIGTVATSRHPFVSEVRRILPNLDDMLKVEYGIGLGHPPVKDFSENVMIAPNKGHGYVASSRDHDIQKELLWTSVVVSALQKNVCHSFEPLVLPVDVLYQYQPEVCDLTKKVFYFNPIFNSEGKNYFFILSDFCSSALYDEKTLTDIPSQEELGGLGEEHQYLERKYGLTFGGASRKFYDVIADSLKRCDGNVKNTLSDLQSRYFSVDPDDVKLLVAATLLNSMGNWQRLWYESRGNGVPLYIIAPEAFHHALNNLRIFDGHSHYEYQYRALSGANDFPIIELVDGKIKSPSNGDLLDLQRRFQAPSRISGEEFYRRIGKIVGLEE